MKASDSHIEMLDALKKIIREAANIKYISSEKELDEILNLAKKAKCQTIISAVNRRKKSLGIEKIKAKHKSNLTGEKMPFTLQDIVDGTYPVSEGTTLLSSGREIIPKYILLPEDEVINYIVELCHKYNIEAPTHDSKTEFPGFSKDNISKLICHEPIVDKLLSPPYNLIGETTVRQILYRLSLKPHMILNVNNIPNIKDLRLTYVFKDTGTRYCRAFSKIDVFENTKQ